MHYTQPNVYEFISKQTNDPIVEWKTCHFSGTKFPIYQSDLEFYEKMSSRFDDGCALSPPTLCPEERCRRRLGRQNMRQLYRRTCDATGKPVISNISPDKSMPVYTQPYRWSDARDFRDYGRDIDFSRPFFEQFNELLQVVPQPNLMANYLLDENSEYTNYAGSNKDCYLIFHADMNRDCLFGVGIKKCKNTVDTIHTHGCEVMYECIDARNCHTCYYSQNIEDCANSWFLKNCLNCKDCTGCVNMVNQQYCFFNQQCTKEEYKQKVEELELHTYSGIQKTIDWFTEFVKKFPHVATEQYQCKECSGDLIFRSERVQLSFDIQECRDVKYCHRIYNGLNDDIYDVNEYGMQISKVYEGLAIGINAQNIITGIYVNEEVDRVSYSMHVHHSTDMFGCISANNAEYCILNKQYTKEEYEKLVVKLIHHMQEGGEWGEFFPLVMSPFGYDETVANEYFPLTKNEAEKLGSPFTSYERPSSDLPNTIQGTDLPETIDEVDDSILQQIIHCSVSGKPYRIIAQELIFYRTHHLPLPRLHPDERHIQRRNQRAPRALSMRVCDETEQEILSVYPAESSLQIWSQEAYNKEVFG